MKELIKSELARRGFTADDVGTHSTESTDYADYAHLVANEVSSGAAARGILLCGTGLGMGYAANRHPGVRAAVVWSPEVATLAREHNDANLLVLPARCIDEDTARAILGAWLDTPFAGGRHARRIAKIETPA
jgi:RpiB/LacA/LacB family sugar-phosphate isomerase